MAQSPTQPQSGSNPAGSRLLRGRMPLVLALILGAVTAGLIVAYLASQDDDGEVALPIDDSVEVVVATQPIAVGETITAEMLEVRELPREAVVSGAATDISQVEDQTARYPVLEGEQISIQRLVDPPAVKSLSFTIPEGMRGYTIPVDMTKSPAALTVPGDFVDVIVAFELIQQLEDGSFQAVEVNDGDALRSAVTLFQNVQVLAVQRHFVDDGVVYDESTRGDPVEDDNNVSFVTLAVTPEQAQTLWLTAQNGSFTLALRGFGDDAQNVLVPETEPIDFLAPPAPGAGTDAAVR